MTNSYKNYTVLKDGLGLRRYKGDLQYGRMIFFPFVGGQSLAFKNLSDVLPDHIELFAIDPPGHGWSKSDVICDFDQMIDLYFNELQSLFEGDYYLYGHSLGGIIAYRLTQMLQVKNNSPKGLFLSASPVPHRVDEFEYMRTDDDQKLIEILEQIGGIPKILKERPSFMKFFTNQIRADIEIFLTSNVGYDSVVQTPITMIYSKEDLFLCSDDVYEWDVYGDNVTFEEVGGNHMFIQSHFEDVAKIITKVIIK